MSEHDDARDLLDAFTDFADPTTGSNYTPSQDRPIRLATVHATDTGTGNVKVTFDGESTAAVKLYPWVGRRPLATERVAMLPVGRGYVIGGTIGYVTPAPVWSSLTLGSSWLSPTTLDVTRIGDVVHFQGEVYGGTIGFGNNIFTLAAAYRPTRRVAALLPDIGAGVTDGVVNIGTDGVTYIARGNGGASSPGLSFGTVSYVGA